MTALFELWAGSSLLLLCSCGRQCPMRWDAALGTLVLDHGGEAVYVMPHEEWAAIPFDAEFHLRDSSLLPWLERVHEYEAQKGGKA